MLGVNGQDGSYLAERLLKQGWDVLGIGRQPNSRWLPNTAGFSYHFLDLCDLSALTSFLHDTRPDAVFHFAAVHGSAGFSYEDRWNEVHGTNTNSVHVILEYLRCLVPDGIFIYASSSKVFGEVLENTISESSLRRSNCIYTTTKNAATDLIVYYRKRHKVNASVVWMFNHESPRRSSSYFIPQVVDTLAKSILDPNYVGKIGTLGFWSDWGDAEEFMDIVANIATKSTGNDLLLATGKTLWAEDFVDALFKKYGLSWKTHLVEKFTSLELQPKKWQADTSKLEAAISRRPVRTIFNIVEDILRLNHPQAYEQVSKLQSPSE